MRRKWPILLPDQSPEGLPARVAFHLHRLERTGSALIEAGFQREEAVDWAQGRRPLTVQQIYELAKRIAVDVDELVRPLTEAEQRSWEFYRTAAFDPVTVWCNAKILWEERGMTQRGVAKLLDMPPQRVSRAVKGKRPVTMSYEMAVALAEALDIDVGWLLAGVTVRKRPR